MLSILEIVTEALDGVGIDPPTSITSGGDLGRRLKGLANAVGQSLAVRHEWQILRTEGTFVTTSGQELQATLSSDFPDARRIVDETLWNRTTQRKLFTVSQRTWARLKSDGVSPATEVYYIKGDQILFPADTVRNGDTIAFEYISRNWARTSGGTGLRRFAGDSDVPKLDDHMFVLGVRWRYLQSLGMEYGEHFREYEDYVQLKISEDRPRENLSLNPHMRSEGYDTQIPDGNWNQ